MKKNIHTSIMLDLECTGILPNPCILQIGAVHFSLDTGEEYSHFCTSVSLKSCEDVKLQSTEETMEWLLKHSPQVLEASRKSEVTIFQALFRFNNFLRKAVRSNRYCLEEMGRLYASDMSELVVWGNGAVADNTWINSAYAACGMADRKPWTYKNDMCVRTLVRTADDILGRDFAKEERFQGTRHDALDDCRHQIRYMVKARNAMKALSEKLKSAPSLVTTLPVREAKNADHDDVLEESGTLESVGPPYNGPSISQVFTTFEAKKVTKEVHQLSVLNMGTSKSPECTPDPQEVGPRTSFQLRSTSETFPVPSHSVLVAERDDNDADLDALVQAAYETYEKERTPRSSQAVVVLPSPDRNDLGIHDRSLDESACGQQGGEILVVKLAEQLEELKVC